MGIEGKVGTNDDSKWRMAGSQGMCLSELNVSNWYNIKRYIVCLSAQCLTDIWLCTAAPEVGREGAD